MKTLHPNHRREELADSLQGKVNTLLETIYQSALDPDNWMQLRDQLLYHFREDKPLAPSSHLVSSILHHIKRALKLGEHHSQRRLERAQLSQVLDAAAPAICVCDAELRLLGANSAARTLLKEQNLISEHSGILHFSVDCNLQPLLSRCESEKVVCQKLQLRNEDEPELWVYVYTNTGSETTFTLILLHRTRLMQVALQNFSRRYRLTEKESQIVDALLHNQTLLEIAKQEQGSVHTVKHHIKNLFAKTGSHSQGELLAQVLRSIIVAASASHQQRNLIPHYLGLAQSHVLSLPHQRQICYAEFGDPAGLPLLYFHSLNSSRLELLHHEPLFMEAGVRLIAIDRAGYGYSPYLKRNDYSEYVSDTEQLLDLLGLQTVAILAMSCGTPHAIACAAMLPDRISVCICTASLTPVEHIVNSGSKTELNRLFTNMLRVNPHLIRPSLELFMHGQTVESLFDITSDPSLNAFHFCDRDRAYIYHPDRLEFFIGATIESLRQGTKAWAQELVLVNRDWNIDFAAIRCPVQFWHGEQDDLVAKDMIESFAAQLPSSRLLCFADESHLLIHRELPNILQEVSALSC